MRDATAEIVVSAGGERISLKSAVERGGLHTRYTLVYNTIRTRSASLVKASPCEDGELVPRPL